MKSNIELNSLALKTRRMWKEDSYSPIDIFAIVNGWKEKKITIIKYPMSRRISGMCTKENDDIIICINSTTSQGRQRFTLAHELYHVLYEENIQRVICDISMNGNREDSEREADQFASYLLMPYDSLLNYEETKEWNLEKIIDAEQFYQVSHQALLYRLHLEGHIDNETFNQFKSIRVSHLAARFGYETDLYLPTELKNQYFTTGEYIRKIEKLAKQDIISSGKKEEMLLEGFRADIVYNLDEEELFIND